MPLTCPKEVMMAVEVGDLVCSSRLRIYTVVTRVDFALHFGKSRVWGEWYYDKERTVLAYGNKEMYAYEDTVTIIGKGRCMMQGGKG